MARGVGAKSSHAAVGLCVGKGDRPNNMRLRWPLAYASAVRQGISRRLHSAESFDQPHFFARQNVRASVVEAVTSHFFHLDAGHEQLRKRPLDI